MGRIILQHWSGPLEPINEASVANIARYAAQCGAEHALLMGNVFSSKYGSYMQKLALMNAVFDGYETVVMVDADMFAVRGLTENIFEVPGCGWHHPTAATRVFKLLPKLTNPAFPFWGGAIYKFTLEQRQRLRGAIPQADLRPFDTMAAGVDEGAFHRLACLSSFPADGAYFSDKRWCWGNCEEPLSNAALIHVRRRPDKDKYQNYLALKKRGILE